MESSKLQMEPLDLGAPSSPASPKFRTIAFGLFLALAVMGWRYMGPKNALASGGWMNDWDSAIQQARASGKPALVLFTADWCPACRQFESETLTDSSIQEYLKENHTLIVVDLTDRAGPNTLRAREFSVQAIPTLILFDNKGDEVARDFGMPADAFMNWLQAKNLSRH